jgi:phage/conjugal plasmid C-4 type zinc finger TraR family protein
MAVGWTRDEAVQEQIDATVESQVQLARRRLSGGESLTHCEKCGEEIPEARRQAVHGVRYCVKCQTELEKKQKAVSLYNRRGSKDSQLK